MEEVKGKALGARDKSGRQQSQPLAKEVHGGVGTRRFLPPLPASITPTQRGQQDWDEEGGSEACRVMALAVDHMSDA